VCNQEAASVGVGAALLQCPYAHLLFALQAGKPRECPRRRVVQVRWVTLELSSCCFGNMKVFVARPSYMKVS